MRTFFSFIARLVGPTFEDWLLGALLVMALALTVVGVRSCDDDSRRDTRAQSVQAR
ncbi:MAG: hypothetical protein NDJ92_00640 [Thermoanaerobaculia bacterium]|nr:hypothetical protein [Thermoanaerobaculia bacterium]